MVQVTSPTSMTPEQFVYWLQGFAEIYGGTPGIEEWGVIKDHLALVFDKKTPDYNKLAQWGKVNQWTEPYPGVQIPPYVPLKDINKTPFEPPYVIKCGVSQDSIAKKAAENIRCSSTTFIC